MMRSICHLLAQILTIFDLLNPNLITIWEMYEFIKIWVSTKNGLFVKKKSKKKKNCPNYQLINLNWIGLSRRVTDRGRRKRWQHRAQRLLLGRKAGGQAVAERAAAQSARSLRFHHPADRAGQKARREHSNADAGQHLPLPQPLRPLPPLASGRSRGSSNVHLGDPPPINNSSVLIRPYPY